MSDTELKLFRADLHIHSCLSPCGDWDMSPSMIIDTCIKRRIDIIAITDHNSIENAAVTRDIGLARGVHVYPSMEICSLEEVHVLALFDTIDDALKMQECVYAHLPGENQPDVFGYQVVADENDDVISQNEKLLIGATTLTLEAIVRKVHCFNGVAIAAHIDKKAFSILGQLGFIPPDLKIDAVEVSFRETPETASEQLLYGLNIPCITSSDAHYPNEIGRVTTKFFMSTPTLSELKKTLTGCGGRRIVYSGSC